MMDNSQTPPKCTIVSETPRGRARWLGSTPGILFETTLRGAQELAPVFQDPYVQKHFGTVLVAEERDNGTLIHGNLAVTPTPDTASPNDTVLYLRDGKVKSFRIIERYAQCTDPTRDLMGCSECPNKGRPCVSGEAHGDPLTLNATDPVAGTRWNRDTYGDLTGELQHKKSLIAGHQFVSGVMVTNTGVTFARSDPEPGAIEWSALEEREEQRSKASKKAAASRKFKRENCDVCVAKAAGCNAYRWCEGAYPSAEAIEAQVLATWLPRLEARQPTECPLEPWQLYAVMWLAGIPGSKAWDRREVLLAGPTWNGRFWGVRITAVRKPADAAHAVSWDWKRLRKVFPELPSGPGEKFTERPPDAALAKLFAALQMGRYASVLRGFRGYVSDPFSFAGIDTRTKELVTGRCMNWGAADCHSTYRTNRVDNWTDFFRYYGRIPLEGRRH